MAKGTTIDLEDPRLVRQRSRAVGNSRVLQNVHAHQTAAAEDYNAKWQIIGTCPVEGCVQHADSGRDPASLGLCEFELVPHALKHVNGRIRHLARMIVELSTMGHPDWAAELVGLFDEKGQLKVKLVEPLK